jgi:hypothetical protein
MEIKSGSEFLGESLLGRIIKEVSADRGGMIVLRFADGLRARLMPVGGGVPEGIVGRMVRFASVRQEGEFRYLTLHLDPSGRAEFLV